VNGRIVLGCKCPPPVAPIPREVTDPSANVAVDLFREFRSAPVPSHFEDIAAEKAAAECEPRNSLGSKLARLAANELQTIGARSIPTGTLLPKFERLKDLVQSREELGGKQAHCDSS
jgi:hypothetical protein